MLQPTIDHIDSYSFPILTQSLITDPAFVVPGIPKPIQYWQTLGHRIYFAWPTENGYATLLLTNTSTVIYHYYTPGKPDLRAFICVDINYGDVYLIPEDACVVPVRAVFIGGLA